MYYKKIEVKPKLQKFEQNYQILTQITKKDQKLKKNWPKLPSSHREIGDGIVVRPQNFWIPENFVTESVQTSQRDAYVRRGDPILKLGTGIIKQVIYIKLMRLDRLPV